MLTIHTENDIWRPPLAFAEKLMKLVISRLIVVLFMLFSVQSFAQWDCKYRRPDVLNCKLCSVTEGIGFSYFKHRGNCWGCTRTCTAIAPIAPSSTGGQSDMRSDHNDYLSFTPDELRERMSGNICRCGAYSNIAEAITEVAGRGKWLAIVQFCTFVSRTHAPPLKPV